MRQRPKISWGLSIIFVGIAISFPFQIAWLYEHTWMEWAAIFNKISLLNAIVMALALLQIPLLLNASRWLAISLPLMLLFVGWNNYVVGTVGNDYSLESTFVGTGLFAMLSLAVFHPQFFALLKRPEQRWWLHAPRKEIEVPVLIDPVRGSSFNAATFDISRTGAFISFDEDKIGDARLETGDFLTIRMTLGTLRRMSCQAKVVRKAQACGSYPEGIGLEFTSISSKDRRLLESYIGQLPFDGRRQELSV